MELLSIFTNELWPIFGVLALLALWFFYQAFKASKSNSTQQQWDAQGRALPRKENTGNVPIYKLPTFWLGVAVVVAIIIVAIVVHGEYA